ncbi:MAG: DNA primase DnaG [Candidatus Pacearchaeota archaeon]
MAKISPVSIKYMIHANFQVEGALEKPDIIGAIFGQTEGLLGNDLEMRELQKEGKIGRIEVEIERKDKITHGTIKIPTALDQSETSLIAAAIETIEKIGPCDAQVEVEKIEDVRGSKREYIIERAKKLMAEISSKTDSREISKEIKEYARIAEVKEYGEEKLPFGSLEEPEIIVVEGRADVLNLLKAGIKNVIAMNGTKLPDSIKALSEQKDITLFVDGDRGGELIIKNVLDNARVKYIAMAPDGKEVEELTGKEILMNLRKKIPVSEFLSKRRYLFRAPYQGDKKLKEDYLDNNKNDYEEKLKKMFSENLGKEKAIIVGEDMNEIKRVSIRTLVSSLKKIKDVYAIVIDGTVTPPILNAAENSGCKIIIAKNFTSTDTSIRLISP